ncbi:hypothetical protein [Burkholderia plantarii]|uniref:hypothetical protein n=1 Tax=Burkholderia plantarii TaxID=41899 RepID=UPI0011DFA285|nr:hypothetical protein [Burkholderia plantarii]
MLQLVRQGDDVVIGSVPIRVLPAGMSSCLMDDRFATWAHVAGTTLRVPMDIAEFAKQVSQARAPENAWVADSLPRRGVDARCRPVARSGVLGGAIVGCGSAA